MGAGGIAYHTIVPLDIVLDTNVLDAALRSTRGASHQIVRRIGTGAFRLHLSVPLAFEIESVLLRHRAALGLSDAEVTGFVDYLCAVATPHDIHYLWRPLLRDPGDEMVAELAVAARADHVVTHNVRDFGPLADRFGVAVTTPGAFLHLLRDAPDGPRP